MVRAAVMVAPRVPIEQQDLPRPGLEAGGVGIETLFSEVCGTDIHLHHGRLTGVPYPIVPGHVTVGKVTEVAGTVNDANGHPIAPGDVVTFLDVHGTCNNCWFCLVAKASTRCPSRRVYGITYGVQDGLTGGWCEALTLKPHTKILRLPENVSPERFIAGGCGLPTALHAIDRAQLRLGSSVAILGSGPVGLNATILARLSGAGKIIVVGAPDHRLDAARAFGADETLSIERLSAEDRIHGVRELTDGRGPDVTIEATGAPEAVVEGMRMTRDAGCLVVVGQYTDAGDVPLNPHFDVNRKHLDIRGCWGSDFGHFYRGIALLAQHQDVAWEQMLSQHYGLDQMNEALDEVEAGQVIKAVVRP